MCHLVHAPKAKRKKNVLDNLDLLLASYLISSIGGTYST